MKKKILFCIFFTNLLDNQLPRRKKFAMVLLGVQLKTINIALCFPHGAIKVGFTQRKPLIFYLTSEGRKMLLFKNNK